MTCEEYYGGYYVRLRQLEKELLALIGQYPVQRTPEGIEPVLYCKSRIKQPESMIAKLKCRGLKTDAHTAVSQMHDAVGVRVICSFQDDVYRISDWLGRRHELTILTVKDYIAYPKPNGYRSLHLIVSVNSMQENGLKAEIQLRTIAIDFWAALEHQMKYKKNIGHEKTIQSELKRCADEIASVDLSMQTLRDLILNDRWAD